MEWVASSHVVILAVAMTVVILYVISRRVTSQRSDDVTPLPPGSLGLPLIGEMLQFAVQAPSGEFFDRRERRHGPIFKTRILGRPTVYVAGPAAVRRVLTGDHSLVEAAWPAPMTRLLGRGALATSTGDEHRTRRRGVLACFGRQRLRRYAPVVRRIIRAEIRRWVNEGTVCDLYAAAKRMTTRAAAKVLFGIDTDDVSVSSSSTSSIERDLGDYAEGLFSLPVSLPGTAYYRAVQAKKRLHGALSSMLCTARPSGEISDVISDIFASAGWSKPEAETAVDQALELLFGGQETLSSLVTCLIMLLAGNTSDGPTYFDKMAADVGRHLPETRCNHKDDVRPETLEQVRYVDAVIKETLRMYPPIGGGYRRALRTFDVQGYTVPCGWSVTYSIKSTHDRSQLFSADADRFDPDRWFTVTDNSSSLSGHEGRDTSFQYLPFCAGARACVGREYAMMFARTFCVELVRARAAWTLGVKSLPVAMLRVPIVRPRDRLAATFTRRDRGSLGLETNE